VNDTITLLLNGDQRFVDCEVLLKHLAVALRGRELVAGVVHQISIDREGGVTVDGLKAYTPTRPQIAAKGA
jgi:hypothetical protein